MELYPQRVTQSREGAKDQSELPWTFAPSRLCVTVLGRSGLGLLRPPPADDRGRVGGQRHVQRQVLGHRVLEPLLAVQYVIPPQRLPGVRGHPPDDGRERALGHLLQLVERLV